MYPFTNLKNAASYALRCRGVALVFDGPGGSGAEYVVAIGREARELLEGGHEAYTLQETAQAAR
jgi:hypothetical protein